MRRLATLDKLLLATLVPLWVVVFALHVRQVVLTGLAEPPVYAWASREPGGYPVVGAFRPALHGEQSGLELGDRLLRVGRVDLAGAGYLRFYASTLAEADAALQVPVTFERNGHQQTIMLAMRHPAIAWYWIPALLGSAITAVLVLLRAPDVQQARLFFAAIMTFIIFCTPFHGSSYLLSYLSRGVLWYGVGGIGFGLVWLWVIWFPGEVARRDRISPAWALLAPVVWYTSRINYVTAGFPAWVVPTLKGSCDAFLMGGGLAIATRNYHRATPIGRRRVKWLLYGAYIAVVPLIVARVLTIIDPAARWYEGVYVATIIGMVAFPLGTLVAIVRYNLFDIDRLITATASYSLVLVVLLGMLLAISPPLARHASQMMGMDRTVAQTMTALVLASLVVPLEGLLRPLIERLFFTERHAFEVGMQELLRDLSESAQPSELIVRVAERVTTLLRPERTVLYARIGDQFAPVFARNAAAAPSPASEAALVAALERSVSPVVVLDAPAAGWASVPAAGERAALALPGVSVVACMRRGVDLTAFVCLGPKRSGDVYTATDLALLGAVAEKASSELLRFRHAEIIAQARERVRSLRAEKDEADRSNLAKSRFLAAASHDLRQPLHALGLFVGALGDRVQEPEARDLVTKIASSTQALEEMFNALLDISKLDAGGMEPNVSDVPLGPLLDRLRDEFHPQAADKGLTLHVMHTRLTVRSDPVLLTRIVQNLVSNAIRYTDRGGVLVGCRRRGDSVLIQVVDTGRGIAPERRREVFEEFRRLESAPEAAADGLGLGLAIVDRLARLLGHDVGLASVPGRGSVFSVTVPRERRVRPADAPRPAVGVDLRDVSVLVVEDDAAVLDAMRQQLEGWGCRVLAATSVAEACAPTPSRPDLIVADYHLGDGVTGIEAISAIRSQLGTAVPALLVTGTASPTALGDARATGFPVLRKPVAPAKLRAALAHLVRR